MRFVMWMVVVVILMGGSSVGATEFQPILLKIDADLSIDYQFDGSTLEIPFTISGTSCSIYFSIFTKDKADEIKASNYGYLGWHTVNRIDTCVYFSKSYSFDVGEHIVTWNGKDMDGSVIPLSSYNFYLWGYDNTSELPQVSPKMITGPDLEYISSIQCIDENSMPLAQPILYTANERWKLGDDPFDVSQKEVTSINLADDWNWQGRVQLNPYDFNQVFIRVTNSLSHQGALQKYKFIPGGEAEIIENWGGEKPFSETFSTSTNQETGVTIANYEYLSILDVHIGTDSNSYSYFYLYDYNGLLWEQIDLSTIWSCKEEFSDKINFGGPTSIGTPRKYSRYNHFAAICSHSSCLIQMISPYYYSESGELDNFIIWSNGNGDYFADRNFEETANSPWICHDNVKLPINSNLAIDNDMFTVKPMESNILGFLAPDGTGIGYLQVPLDDKHLINGIEIIDCGTNYDGIYINTLDISDDLDGSEDQNWEQEGMQYIAHDVVKGMITGDYGHEAPPRSVETDIPTTNTLYSNYPNPFNPVTTMPFSLARESEITLTVYNITGEKVATLADSRFSAGNHSINWDASNCASGVYFYCLSVGDYIETRKMMVMK